MLGQTDWNTLPTFRSTFVYLSQCQAVRIDPKPERNNTEDNLQQQRCELQISLLLPSVDSLNELRVHLARREFQATTTRDHSKSHSILARLYKVLMNVKQLKNTSC
jgi:hypothetical protein